MNSKENRTNKYSDKQAARYDIFNFLVYYQSLPVAIKAFKTIDVKDPYQILWIWILPNWDINFINKPVNKM